MNKALFLDRDGVVNVEKNYVYKISDLEFVDGIFKLCNYFKKNNFLIFIITNQSGVARGFFSIKNLEKLHQFIVSEFSKRNINIEKIYYCPHHPDFGDVCVCRKPDPGMILNAAAEFNLDLKKSILIGDRESDIVAGKRAGILRTYKIKSNNLSSFLKKIA